MTDALYLLLWLAVGAASSHLLLQNFARDLFSVSTGFAFGTLFFISTPALVFMLAGSLTVPDPLAPSTYQQLEFHGRDLYAATLLLAMVFLSLVFVSLTNSVLVRRMKSNRPRQSTLTTESDEYSNGRLLLTTILLGLSYSIYLLNVHTESAHWHGGRAQYFQESGLPAFVLLSSIFFLRLYLLAQLALRYLDKRLGFTSLALLVLFLGTIDILVTGNRIFIMLAGATLAFAAIQRRQWSAILSLAILALPLAGAMSLFGFFRALMWSEGYFRALEFGVEQLGSVEGVPWEIFAAAFESANFNVAVRLTDLIRGTNMGGDQLTLLKILQLPIPRVLLPEKLESITIFAASLLDSRHSDIGLSLVTLVHTEAFVNLRYLAPIAVWLVVLTYALLFEWRHDKAMRIVGCCFGIAAVRFPVSDLLVSAVLGLILMVGLNALLRLQLSVRGACLVNRAST